MNDCILIISPIMHHFLHFDYIMRLTPLEFLEVKRLGSHIFMSYVDVRTLVNFNGSVDTNYLEEEEENVYSTFLGDFSMIYVNIRSLNAQI